MGYRDFNERNEVSESSKKLERIDKLLTHLNISWITPLNIDISSQIYYYEIIISLLEVLYLEISSELTPAEELYNIKQRDKINTFLINKPIFIYRADNSMSGRKRKTIRDNNNWMILKELLFDYDRKIRGWINNHLRKQIYVDEGDIVDGDEPIPKVDVPEEDEE